MSEPTQLPYLLRLLDDESAVVRESVTHELMALGPELDAALESLAEAPGPAARKLLDEILAEGFRQRLRRAWPLWGEGESESDRLERALSALADYVSRAGEASTLSGRLDELVAAYTADAREPEALSLSRFLFREYGFCGAETDYYNPLNSSLLYVIERKRGIPISLSCVFILVANRLGLDVQGYNFPGHFLARCQVRERDVLVDGFNGGLIIETDELESMARVKGRPVASHDADSAAIVARVLRNLINAYGYLSDMGNAHVMTTLFTELENEQVR